jgi:hypothetical protein
MSSLDPYELLILMPRLLYERQFRCFDDLSSCLVHGRTVVVRPSILLVFCFFYKHSFRLDVV